MTNKNDAIPGWNPSVATGGSTSDPHRMTIGDGVKLGIGIALAWVVVIPIAFVAATLALSLVGRMVL